MAEEHELLITRQLGKKMKDQLVSKFTDNSQIEIIYLDFSNIIVLDFSWADEFVAKLAVELNANLHGEKALVVANCTDDQFENINAALLQRALTLTAEQEGKSFFIGDLKEPLLETLTWVGENSQVTARDLANHFGLAINTASNRLSELAKRRLLFRGETIMESGGKQFSYFPIRTSN
jgi:hypothetical protein